MKTALLILKRVIIKLIYMKKIDKYCPMCGKRTKDGKCCAKYETRSSVLMGLNRLEKACRIMNLI